MLIAHLSLYGRENWIAKPQELPASIYYQRGYFDTERTAFNSASRKANAGIWISKPLRLPPPPGDRESAAAPVLFSVNA